MPGSGTADDEALRSLLERVVLTSAVCRELLECTDEQFAEPRPRAALDLLRRWVGERYQADPDTDPDGRRDAHLEDGVETMIVPPGAEEVMTELRAGVAVCEDYALLQTAETASDLAGDLNHLWQSLSAWQETIDGLRDGVDHDPRGPGPVPAHRRLTRGLLAEPAVTRELTEDERGNYERAQIARGEDPYPTITPEHRARLEADRAAAIKDAERRAHRRRR